MASKKTRWCVSRWGTTDSTDSVLGDCDTLGDGITRPREELVGVWATEAEAKAAKADLDAKWERRRPVQPDSCWHRPKYRVQPFRALDFATEQQYETWGASEMRQRIIDGAKADGIWHIED